MDADDDLRIPDDAEFHVDGLNLEWADAVQTDDDGLAWLAQAELPSNIEGIDWSQPVPDGGERMA